ncbi:hypothetical protein O156_gp59 [Mycobacterium phage LittleCherry]|uniref:Uncharacterized protein n=1 Tax=Mycobacterium phage LittleCherry TaxID=1340818 RepID=S5YKG3_9CAUD|nr:hypothetical protein O156_gp59 [Mycobacterium phage LittleCherry]AGT11918.1 hypothetical protein PBI_LITTLECHERRY_35 [Mycobacterium phage LittleCherry]
MENDEFFDFIYQEWSKTTGAQDRFYVVVDQGETAPKAERFLVKASAEDGSDVFVASFEEEADADWFASVHGCFADLIRTLKDQADEIERLDERVDDQEHDIFNLVMTEKSLREEVSRLQSENDDLLTEVSSLEEELSYAYSDGSEF